MKVSMMYWLYWWKVYYWVKYLVLFRILAIPSLLWLSWRLWRAPLIDVWKVEKIIK